MPHSHVVPHALAGKTYTSSAFSTEQSPWAGQTGNLPKRLRDVYARRVREGHIKQTIFSYSTPIAWLDGDVWVVPDVRYSIVTSTKHQVHLYKLPNRRTVVWDTPLDEYLRVIADLMYYGSGRTFPGRLA